MENRKITTQAKRLETHLPPLQLPTLDPYKQQQHHQRMGVSTNKINLPLKQKSLPYRLSPLEDMSLSSLLNSKSSDSTKKRYTRLFYKAIKDIPIGEDIKEANKYKEFYKAIKEIPKLGDDITEKLFVSHLKKHIRKLFKDTEIPDKYRYPLRDDRKYKYVLRKEIPIAKLNNYLCGNTSPGVFELLKDNPTIPMDWSLLAKHPEAFSNKDELINRITDLETKHKDREFWNRFWCSLCENTNPIVINFIKKKINDVKTIKNETGRTFKRKHYNILAKNPTPEAIQLVEDRIVENNIKFRENPDQATEPYSENEEFFNILSTNPTKEAFNLLYKSRIGYFRDFENVDMKIIWKNLFANPAAINFIIEDLYNLRDNMIIKDYYELQNYLQKNPDPKAFPLLEKNKGPIIYNYNYLSENPCSWAIKLLKERMIQEKKLKVTEYNVLINDSYKSGLINWDKVSKNPRAHSLILAKIKEEKGMETEIEEYRKRFHSFDHEKYLNWDYVSANPAIFTRTKIKQ
jgi:thiol-disulfide isomerase/thioredoxin